VLRTTISLLKTFISADSEEEVIRYSLLLNRAGGKSPDGVEEARRRPGDEEIRVIFGLVPEIQVRLPFGAFPIAARQLSISCKGKAQSFFLDWEAWSSYS
jgi:hypothetical protein